MRRSRRDQLDVIAALNQKEYARQADPEIETRISQYEMAFRMQSSVPELTGMKDESEATFEAYGPQSRQPGSFAANCLPARRLGVKEACASSSFTHRGGCGPAPRTCPVICVCSAAMWINPARPCCADLKHSAACWRTRW